MWNCSLQGLNTLDDNSQSLSNGANNCSVGNSFNDSKADKSSIGVIPDANREISTRAQFDSLPTGSFKHFSTDNTQNPATPNSGSTLQMQGIILPGPIQDATITTHS